MHHGARRGISPVACSSSRRVAEPSGVATNAARTRRSPLGQDRSVRVAARRRWSAARGLFSSIPTETPSSEPSRSRLASHNTGQRLASNPRRIRRERPPASLLTASIAASHPKGSPRQPPSDLRTSPSGNPDGQRSGGRALLAVRRLRARRGTVSHGTSIVGWLVST